MAELPRYVWNQLIGTLVCPRCNEDYLHHGTVQVFDRREDAELTAVSTVCDGLVSNHLRPSEGLANPSSRRHGVLIGFWCETCTGSKWRHEEDHEETVWLSIAQHKGMTHIGWVYENTDGLLVAAAFNEKSVRE